MTPRQARTERRAAERKAAKLAYKAEKTAYPSSDRKGAPSNPAGFVWQIPAPTAAPARSGFVSQTSPVDEPAFLSEANSLQREIPRRAEINRANSQHRTGPRTSAGKKDEAAPLSEPKTQARCSSRNSLKHGLASGQVIISGEDPAAFESLLSRLLEEFQPTRPTEELLIQEMAQSYWLTKRALRLQSECFTPEGVDDKRLSLYMRYHVTHERAFHKALGTLMKIKKEQARGFVSQARANSQKNSGFVSQKRIETAPIQQFVPQNAGCGDQNKAPLAKAEAA